MPIAKSNELEFFILDSTAQTGQMVILTAAVVHRPQDRHASRVASEFNDNQHHRVEFQRNEFCGKERETLPEWRNAFSLDGYKAIKEVTERLSKGSFTLAEEGLLD